MALQGMEAKAVSLTGAQAGIVTDGVHTKAKIFNITPKQIHEHLDGGSIVIVAGFQGQTAQGDITTLGRGGSDLTAIALAAALKADKCEIYTDVDGSVEFANKFNVLFEVRSSFNQNPGTIVKAETPGMEDVVIRGVSIERNQAKVTIEGVPDKTGTAAKIFNALAAANVVVDVIVQTAPHEGMTDISFTTNKDELQKAGPVLKAVAAEIGARGVTQTAGVAKLSVVGIGMRSHSGVAAKLFDLLSKGGFNIQMISTSEIKIAVILDEDRIADAAKAAHAGFGLSA
jgi:aspartate kinase